MRLKSIFLGIVLMLGIIAPFTPALADSGPDSLRKLPVKMEFRDDGAHAFMPKWEPLAQPASIRLQNPTPEPQPIGATYLWRICGDDEDRASAGVLRRLGVLTKSGGKLRVNVDGYAGASLRKAVPVAAVLLGMQYQAFDQAWISGHVGVVTSGGQPSGLCVGVSWNAQLGASPTPSTQRTVLSAVK